MLRWSIFALGGVRGIWLFCLFVLFVLHKMDVKFAWKDQCPGVAKKAMRKKNGKWREECTSQIVTFTQSYSNQDRDPQSNCPSCQQLEALSFFVFFFLPCPWVCGILVPPPGIKPGPPAVGVRSPNHWTPGKSRASVF